MSSSPSRRIQESSQRLSSTLDAVLQLSELEAGTYELEREQVALREVVTNATELLKPWTGEEGIEMQVEADRSVVGHRNEGALRRITENLMEKAIKFTPTGGAVVVRVDETDQAGILEVEDTGVGIEKGQCRGCSSRFARSRRDGIESTRERGWTFRLRTVL